MDPFTKKILKAIGIYIIFAVIVIILFQTVDRKSVV